MSAELLKFNEVFPNSKYREINPQYTGPKETAEDMENYQKSKRPINSKLLLICLDFGFWTTMCTGTNRNPQQRMNLNTDLIPSQKINSK